MGMRRKARECVLQMLYQLDLGGGSVEDAVSSFWEDALADDDVKLFANELVRGVAVNIAKIDEIISQSSTNWKISRMAAVDKNILRTAVYEIKFRDDIPVKVAINEAVEIAKRYGTGDSGAFVNGILDNIARDMDELKKDY